MFKIKRKQETTPRPESTGDKIAIAIPHVDHVYFEWAVALRSLRSPVPSKLIHVRSYTVDRARNALVEMAKQQGATFIFFLDSDLIVNPDALSRLYAHNLPIVSGVYTGWYEGKPAISTFADGVEYTDRRPIPFPEMEKYPLYTRKDLLLGMGCCLIRMDVFEQLEKPYFIFNLDATTEEGKKSYSEDFYFCKKAHEKNIPIHVDTVVHGLHLKHGVFNIKHEFGAMNFGLNTL